VSTLIDLWRAVDPEARLVVGDPAKLNRAVRGVRRTRAAQPHLPVSAEGDLLVVDFAVLGVTDPEALCVAVAEAGLTPAAVLLAGLTDPARLDLPDAGWPVLSSALAATTVGDGAGEYLDDERGFVARVASSVRLAAAEAALADPNVAAPAGLVAARLRRGVAVAVGGELRSLHPRPAGRALAARFAALHARLLAGSSGRSGLRRTREGLWLVEQPIRSGASVWLFDDLPLARVDTASVEALAITLRALLRRPAAPETAPAAPIARAAAAQKDPLSETLLAVARANGRVAPAARALGVHRNTVLYRLRVARAERGIDPRRPADALQLLRQAEATDST
jgi:hypothetical protein